jgi:signal peptidase II
MRLRKAHLFWPVALTWLVIDRITKVLVTRYLAPGERQEFIGDVVRFTLTFNRGGAFGISLGPASRWILLAVALLMLTVVWWWYRSPRHTQPVQIGGLALIAGGAVGNMLDRLLSARGVVDFIDVGIGDARWWTFNAADAGISVGAGLVLWSIWRLESQSPSPGEA